MTKTDHAAPASNVMIAVPTLNSMVHASMVEFIATLASGAGSANGTRFQLTFASAASPVHFARNLLVGSFLSSDCDALWFIDADMVPTPDTVHMLTLGADIVAARAPILQTRPTGAAVLYHAAYVERAPDGGFSPVRECREPIPIVAAGTGCLLIRRSVLEDSRMRLPPEYVTVDGDLRSLVDEEDAVPAIFRTLSKPNGHTLIGEDIDFVYRAHRLGYKCIYDPVAQVGHFKSVNLGAIETLLSSMG